MGNIVTPAITCPETLYTLCNGDSAAINTLITVFKRTFGQDLSALNLAMQNGSHAMAAALAHRMSGSAHLVGALDAAEKLIALSVSCAQIRTIDQSTSWRELHPILLQILQEVATFECATNPS